MTDFSQTFNPLAPETPPMPQQEQPGQEPGQLDGARGNGGLDPVTGRFLPGNAHSLQHGLFSRRFQNALLPEQAALRAAVAERRLEWVRDLGDDLSFGQKDLVDRGLQLHVILDSLEADMAKFGVLTGKGAARACVSLYLTVLDKLLKIYQQLGLERRPRRVPSLSEVLEAEEPPSGE